MPKYTITTSGQPKSLDNVMERVNENFQELTMGEGPQVHMLGEIYSATLTTDEPVSEEKMAKLKELFKKQTEDSFGNLFSHITVEVVESTN